MSWDSNYVIGTAIFKVYFFHQILVFCLFQLYLTQALVLVNSNNTAVGLIHIS